MSSIRKKVLVVHPSEQLRGTLNTHGVNKLPGDKSISHRAVLLASLADGVSQIDNFLQSGVTEVMVKALQQVGVHIWQEGDKTIIKGIGLQGKHYSQQNPHVIIDCGNSGTTMRLLAGALAAWGIGGILDGTERLRSRPMKRIVEPLRKMGLHIESQSGFAPLKIFPRKTCLKPLDYELNVASAQVKTCLLLAGLSANGITRLKEPGPSRDHTERLLKTMEVKLTREKQERGFLIEMMPPENRELQPLTIEIPGDFSSASFFIVAGLITSGSRIRIKGVGLNPTRIGLLDTLNEMGAKIEITRRDIVGGEPLGDLEITSSNLIGVEVGGERVVRMIDEFPVFGVAAAMASGDTIVRDAQELRYKETDRITSLTSELRKLGVEIKENKDGFVIHGKNRMRGAEVNAHEDHRLAMALSVAGLVADSPVEVHGSEIISESLPSFVSLMRNLGAKMTME